MKTCTQCGIDKPEDAFEMQPSRGRRRAECRECRRVAERKRRAKRKLNPPKPKSETKQCKRCQEIKPISEFSPASPGYFHNRCKVCESDLHREKRQEQYINDPTARFFRPFVNDAGITVKRCTHCHTEKPVSEFYKNGKHGMHGKCKECDKTIKKANYDADPEKYRAEAREYAQKHPEERRLFHKRWRNANRSHYRRYRMRRYWKNREKINNRRKERYYSITPEERHAKYLLRQEYFLNFARKNRERIQQYQRMWRKANPDKHADTENRRRARKRNAPLINKIDRMTIIEREKWTCYLCGVICTRTNVTLDHVIPLYHGGSHTTDNLRVACRSCNSSKGTKLLKDFIKTINLPNADA